MSPSRLWVVCPCFNEQEGVVGFFQALREQLDRLEGVTYRVLFVDDGSGDATLARLNELAAAHPAVRVCALSRNFGHQAAISAGLDHALTADAVVVMDSDQQHPPAVIPELVAAWRAGADVVLAVRRSSAGEGLLKRWTSRGFYRVFNALSDTPITPGAADFYLLSARARAALCAMPERNRFLRGLVQWLGFPRATVEFHAPARAAGESKYGPWRMLRLAFDALFSFSVAPVRLAVRLGVCVACLGVAYLAYVLGRYALRGDLVPGWGSLISVVLILGGAQLMFVGLIGEYVARMLVELKARPLYLLKQAPAGDEP